MQQIVDRYQSDGAHPHRSQVADREGQQLETGQFDKYDARILCDTGLHRVLKRGLHCRHGAQHRKDQP